MTTIVLAPEYGYTAAVALLSIAFVAFLGGRVHKYREFAQVPLPFPYADASECKDDHKKYIFNCYQRVHQNTLEGFAAYLLTLMFAGLQYPITSAAFGGVWFVGRILYYIGYTTGDPTKRHYGTFGHVGEFGLLGLSAKVAFDLITSQA
ncbi:Microsomal glutathione S-transferase 3 [Modicella reniformis]|uniref:Microsomal glutathione S-transferase 3 n=1 Tax=Modicella reniformis TaxID=1440133 RepID=A0A9P6MMF6_9FUNG|nr:Microsomal glutathione S-transferase 3 [Modicella reniformis]